ncbi:MAG TPA: DNA ligase D [Terracidiphilus sp.]|nr:DNA ligase D [Terracidiphilus sp.]
MSPRTKSRSESAKAVDRQLARYRSMRDFEITPEPQGNAQEHSRPQGSVPMPFVVQKHAATRLHYDFRLGWRGVLKSWAVAKGPSYFPGDKRLAVEVEDHPMEYGGFEGTIPKGQYGGGTVMVWDFGEWKPLGDVEHGLEKGDLKFELNGKKLKGKWVLVRMRRKPDERSDKPNWLLIKERDEYVQPEDAPAITDEAPNSAITQRTIEQIKESKDHVWDSNRGLLETASESGRTPPAQGAGAVRQRKRAVQRVLKDAPREEFPGFVPPQLAQQARNVPDGNEWIHELKLDGYRMQVHVQSKKERGSLHKEATLFTRTGLDWTARMPGLARAAAKFDAENCILDGEVVALDREGRSNFSDLQAAFAEGRHGDLIFFAFDLLHLNGRNLRKLPLAERKEMLSSLFSWNESASPLRLSEHIEGRGSEVFAKACELGAEGIVSKLASARYTSGRGNTWLKMKCGLQQEFVIGGFTPLKKGGRGIGALLLGYYDGGKLRYAGRCGTGFSEETHRALRSRLDALIQKEPEFAKRPSDAPRESRWVRPDLVAQISFSAWTRDGLIRQASFKGLREDKAPGEVKRELPAERCECSEDISDPAKGASLPEPEDKPGKKKGLNGFRITHPNKVVDQKSGATKQQLAEYYLSVAEHILPHIADRPLSVVRCPNGVGKPCFFQKHLGPGSPHGVNSIVIANRKTGKNEDFLTVNSVEGLLGLVQLGVLEIHPWGSKNGSIDRADRIIFDLDPDEAVPWTTLASAAQELRALLKQFKLTSFLKSTGGKGLHVVVPIQPEYEWPIIKQFSHAVVLRMEKGRPGLYITKMSKASRVNKIYLDYLRNDQESTAIAPFSTRARPGVPVAVTLDWKELESSALPRFYLADFARWKQRLSRDPWKAMARSNQRLTEEALVAFSVKLS